MYRESQHYLALIRFPTLWSLLYCTYLYTIAIVAVTRIVHISTAVKTMITLVSTTVDGQNPALP